MHEVIEKAEDYLLGLIARIDEGDENALLELKNMKRYMAELNSILDLIDEKDTMEDIKEKLNHIEKRFEGLLMDLNLVVG